MKHLITLLLLFLLPLNSSANKPQLLLAKTYHSDIELKDYWVSEKLDGVRAYWDGRKLISRQGIIFNTPQYFTKNFPQIALDGELWLDRNKFATLSGLVRRKTSHVDNWKEVKYMIFDLPNSQQTFDIRILKMQSIIQKTNIPHLRMIAQYKIKTHQELMHKLDQIVSIGGEGLMLHKGSSTYKNGRSNDLLKLKKYFDDEAIVIQHMAGKGKYTGMMGALLVETSDKIRFKIGTGFSDEERKNPPPIGSEVTFKYFGFTHLGVPRFASFMRIRSLMNKDKP